jgi:hypothetical protein
VVDRDPCKTARVHPAPEGDIAYYRGYASLIHVSATEDDGAVHLIGLLARLTDANIVGECDATVLPVIRNAASKMPSATRGITLVTETDICARRHARRCR